MHLGMLGCCLPNGSHFAQGVCVCVCVGGGGGGGGVTKAPFVNFSVSKIFDMTKVHIRFFESHSYLTGVTAAELRRNLLNINVIYNS